MAMLGRPITSQQLEERMPYRQSLYSLAEIRDAAHAFGFSTLPVRWSFLYPRFPVTPAILPVIFRDHPHFVVVTDSRLGQLCLVDVMHTTEPVWVSESDLRKRFHWDGTALHIGADGRFLMIYAWVFGPWLLVGVVVLLSVRTVYRRRVKWLAPFVGMWLLIVIAGCTRQQDDVRFEPNPIVAEQGSDEASGTYRCSLVNDTSNPVSLRSLRTSCSCLQIESPSMEASSVVSIPGRSKREFILHVDYPVIGKREVGMLAECVTDSADASGSGFSFSVRAKVVASANLRRVPKIEWANPRLDLVVDRPGVTQEVIELQTIEGADSPEWITGLQIVDKNGPVATVTARLIESIPLKDARLCKRRYECVAKLDRSRLQSVSGLLRAKLLASDAASSGAIVSTIAVHVKCPFRVRPVVVILHRQNDGPGGARVTVDYDADLSYRVRSAELSCDSSAVKVGGAVGHAHKLTQTVSWEFNWNTVIDADAEPGEKSYTLTLHTDHPWYRSITVPVIAQ